MDGYAVDVRFFFVCVCNDADATASGQAKLTKCVLLPLFRGAVVGNEIKRDGNQIHLIRIIRWIAQTNMVKSCATSDDSATNA